ncbi:unnamed protein product [Victoria cruziana]
MENIWADVPDYLPENIFPAAEDCFFQLPDILDLGDSLFDEKLFQSVEMDGSLPSAPSDSSQASRIADSLPKKRTGERGSKKRKSDQLGVQVTLKTMSDVEVLDDGYRWRKYGKKMVKDNQNPRNYYRCSHGSCNVKKRVERDRDDPRFVITTYEGTHNHECPYIVYYVTPQEACDVGVISAGKIPFVCHPAPFAGGRQGFYLSNYTER